MVSILSSGLTRHIPTRISLFVLLNVVDYIFTPIALEAGIEYEGNPFLGQSLWCIGVTKLLVSVLVLRYLSRQVPIMNMLNIGLSLVVTWNLAVLICGVV